MEQQLADYESAYDSILAQYGGIDFEEVATLEKSLGFSVYSREGDR